MAVPPKKAMDPTEEAMSAIHEALSLRDPERSPAARPQRKGRASARPANDLDAHPFDRGRPAPALSVDEEIYGPRSEDLLPRPPANDDRERVGETLQRLHARSKSRTWLWSGLFAIVWTFLVITLAPSALPDARDGQGVALGLLGLSAAVALPVILFFVITLLFARARELREISESMAQIAVRLGEPDSFANEAIVSVGQAIRREVTAMGDGVERALARAAELESLVHNEVSQLERAYNDNELRIRGLLDDLAAQRDHFVGQADQVRQAIQSVHLDITQDIAAVGEVVAEKVKDAAVDIARQIGEKGEHITLALGRAGDVMIESLGERGGDLLERLERTGLDTSESLTRAGEQLTQSLDVKSASVTREFEELAGNLATIMQLRLANVTNEFAERSTAIVEMMGTRSSELTESLTENSSRLAETIALRGEEVNNTLKATGESLILDLSLRSGDIVIKLEHTSSHITDSIITRGNSVMEAFRENADALAENVLQRTDSVRDLLAARLQSFEEMFTHGGRELAEKIGHDSAVLGSLITRNLSEFERTVKTYGGELVERLSERTASVTSSMQSNLDQFDQRVTARTADVTSTLEARIDSLHAAVDARTANVAGVIDARLTAFEQTVEQRTAGFSESLGQRVTEIAQTLAGGGKRVLVALDRRVTEAADVINDRTEKLTEALTGRVTEIETTLGTRAQEVAETLDTRIGRFEELLVGRAEAVTEQLEQRAKSAAEVLNSRMEQLAQSVKNNTVIAERAIGQLSDQTTSGIRQLLDHSAGTIRQSAHELAETLTRTSAEVSERVQQDAAAAEERLVGASSKVGSTLAQGADAVEQRLTGLSSQIASTLQQDTASIVEKLTGVSSHVGQSLQQNAAAVQDKLTGVSTSVSAALKESAGDAERTLLAVGAKVSGEFVGKADQIAAVVAQRADEMTRVLDTNSSRFLSALSTKSQAFTGEIGRATDNAVKSIESKGFEFTQTMLDNSSEIARQINEASEHATQNLSHSMKSLHEEAGRVIEQSQRVSTAAVSEMLETHGLLRNDTTALFEQLRGANSLIQDVLTTANANMGGLEQQLSQRVSEFVSAWNSLSERSIAASAQVKEHVTAFQSETSRALEDLRSLANQFDTHSRVIIEAVDSVDKSNARTGATIEERKTALDSLVATLDIKAEDLETRLKRFSDLLDDSLEGASSRARDISRIIAETSGEGVRQINEQFAAVRNAAEGERKTTMSTLEKVYEQAIGDAQAMLRQSADRFSDVLQGIRQMSTDIQQELDATREDLRSGVFRLPEETAEATAKMRRVVLDQLEALAELNHIVARHGRSTAESVEQRRAQEPMLTVIGGGRAEPARPVSRAEPERFDPPPPPPPASRGRRGEPPAGPLPTAARSAPPAAPAGSWLSDVLSRASRPEGEGPDGRRPEHHAIESLDSLSVDIARMIDHDAAVELWDRYKRGERNVFTRRLYTIQGRKTFEDIRNRYRSDREFKQTVDRYIDEFERLLEEVAQDGRGPMVAHTYLTSETGKVYTMLAHAAGRFD